MTIFLKDADVLNVQVCQKFGKPLMQLIKGTVSPV